MRSFSAEFCAKHLMRPNSYLSIYVEREGMWWRVMGVGERQRAVMGKRNRCSNSNIGRRKKTFVYIERTLIVRNGPCVYRRVSNKGGHPFYLLVRCATFKRLASLQFHTIYKHMYYLVPVGPLAYICQPKTMECHQAEYSMCKRFSAVRLACLAIEIETNECGANFKGHAVQETRCLCRKTVNFTILLVTRTLREFETEIDPFCFVTGRSEHTPERKELKKKTHTNKMESNWKQYTKVVHNFWRVCHFGILLRRMSFLHFEYRNRKHSTCHR